MRDLVEKGWIATRTWVRLGLLAAMLTLVSWWIAPPASNSLPAPLAAVPEAPRAAESGEVAPEASRAIVEVPLTPESSPLPTAIETKPIPERFPAPPGVPGELPVESGSIEERAWILRRALHDLQGVKHVDQRIAKMGDEMLPVAIGGILDLKGAELHVVKVDQRRHALATKNGSS